MEINVAHLENDEERAATPANAGIHFPLSPGLYVSPLPKRQRVDALFGSPTLSDMGAALYEDMVAKGLITPPSVKQQQPQQPPQQLFEPLPPPHHVALHPLRVAESHVSSAAAVDTSTAADWYATTHRTAITNAPLELFTTYGSIAPRPHLYVYLMPTADVPNFVASCLAMTVNLFDAGVAAQLQHDGDKSFLVNKSRQKIAETALIDNTIFLPLRDDHVDYAACLKGHLVLIGATDDRKTVNTLAIGVFVGDDVYANTLDPSTRLRARPERLSDGLDAHQLLAPVHVVTPLLEPGKKLCLHDWVGPDAAACMDIAGTVLTFAGLPSPLEVGIVDVRAHIELNGTGGMLNNAHLMTSALLAMLKWAAEPRHGGNRNLQARRLDMVATLTDVLLGRQQREEPAPLGTGTRDRGSKKNVKWTTTMYVSMIAEKLRLVHGDRADIRACRP